MTHMPSVRSAMIMAGGDETIVACATAEGRGALTMIRMTGARAIEIARALGASALKPRVSTRVMLHHPTTGAHLDDALVTAFMGPHSFTGEDVVEYSVHGGRVVSALVIAACVAAGARPALPGEFTRRAVINGKLDLVQAEAVADLIDARTVAMQQQALAQLDGGLSRRLLALRDRVIHVEALLAYDIDFPDEDDGPIAPARIHAAATALLSSIDALLATAPRAAMLRDGALVVIAGPPNAGKSSLFNALLGESRALVTPIAGTTRDAIDAVMDRAPVPLRLVDTAGLRQTDDTLEQLGIEVSLRFLAQAQVVLACGATPDEVTRAIDAVRPRTGAVIVPVHTKCDLASGAMERDAARDVASNAPSNAASNVAWCYASAETGEGLAHLLMVIDAQVAPAAPSHDGSPSAVLSEEVVVTRERHQRGLREAAEEIQQFIEGWGSGALPATVAAVHLHGARDALAGLVGAIGTEDVLDRVFRDFCIGK